MVRPAEPKDLSRILEIYNIARRFMRQNGNYAQWGTVYPPRTMLKDDVRAGQLYVCRAGDVIYGVFAFILGDDPTYAYIEDGSWKNDGPYGTIHRVASDGTVRGVFSECLDYCRRQMKNIRIDTHESNLVMRHLVTKHGFERSGVIYLADGSPRIAYEYWEA